MILKEISYNQLREAISVSFLGDSKIFELYDVNVTVENVDQIVEDIYRKICEYGNGIILKGVYVDDELIGYVVRMNDLLISFSMAVKFRNNDNTKEFFRLIKEDFRSKFFCHLWSINKRAATWLKKMGMQTIFENNQIIKLECRLPQES